MDDVLMEQLTLINGCWKCSAGVPLPTKSPIYGENLRSLSYSCCCWLPTPFTLANGSDLPVSGPSASFSVHLATSERIGFRLYQSCMRSVGYGGLGGGGP